MNNNIKRIWALTNSVLLVLVLVCLAIWPERFFIIGRERRPVEFFVFFTIVSTAVLLLTLFITSFMNIQRNRECKEVSIFHLIGSMLSLLFLMAVKVLADEIGHEWIPEAGNVTQQGEFWIMYACLGLVLGFMLRLGLKSNKER